MKGDNKFISKILFKLLLFRGSDYAMMKAIEKDNVEVVKLLLADERVDPAAKNNAAFRLAVFKGNEKVVKLLLADRRVDPSADNNYAIRTASYLGYE